MARPVSASAEPILFLLSSLIVGGSERKAVALANALKARGWQVHVAYLDASQRSPATLLGQLDRGIPVECLQRQGYYSPAAAARLFRYIKAHAIGTVACMNLYPLVYAAPLMALPGMRSVRWLALVNTTEPRKTGLGSFMFLYRPVLRRVDRVVFGALHQQRLWVEACRLDPARVTHVYNGTDLSRFAPLSAGAGGEKAGLTIGAVGQLRIEKNQRELLIAAAELIRQGWRLKVLLVGDGPERAALEESARQLAIDDCVEFCGELSDVQPALAKMDVFVLPSRSETFSNAALEAMAMGRPVVLSRVGSAAEMVTHGYDGYLYPAGEPLALAEVLRTLIGDELERRRVGANARATVEQRFAFEGMVSAYERVLRDE
jgi:glycosyltransferase involved in cell wall biosynthesis